MNTTRQTMDVKEVAAYLGVSKDLIYDFVQRKKIPCVRIGRRILFKKASVDAWWNEKENECYVEGEV